MKNRVPDLIEILKLDKISHFPPKVILDIYGELLEHCRNHTKNHEDILIKWKNFLDESENIFKKGSLAYVFYYYFSLYWTIQGSQNPENKDDWYNYFQERSIFCLRKSVASFNQMVPEDTYPEMMNQILSNLAAQMADMGRNVEALKYFQRVLDLNNDFNMALGNMGICLLELAQSSKLMGEKFYLLQKASVTLKQVQDDHIVSNENFTSFSDALRETENQLKLIPHKIRESEKTSQDFPTDMEQAERDYRIWAVEHKLFLNLLCEADLKDKAASDNLALYKSKYKKDVEFLKYNSYFNHITEQFTMSRWFFYEGTHPQVVNNHFSGMRIFYSDLGDDSVINIGKQRVLASFMLCYSILDKLALFINDYFELNIFNRTDLNLRSLWYQDFPHNKNLRKSIRKYIENPHLKALYWLSKDVYYREQHEEILEPSARDWRKIRNHLAHEFIRVTENELDESSHECDPNTYCISLKELQDRCLSMLQLIRDSIVYLTLAVSYEETKMSEKEILYTPFDAQFSEEPIDFIKK